MKITRIQNTAIFNKTNRNSVPVVQNKRPFASKANSLSGAYVQPSFLGGIICFNTLKNYEKHISPDVKSSFEVKINRNIKEEHIPLFDKADEAKTVVPSIVARFDEIYDYADETIINAKESYTIENGKLSRYTLKCAAQIDSDNFIANDSYKFKRGVFKGYDRNLTVSAGTEYSSEYYEFKIHPRYEYSPLYISEAEFSRYVKNKVAVNDIVYYSSNEIIF